MSNRITETGAEKTMVMENAKVEKNSEGQQNVKCEKTEKGNETGEKRDERKYEAVSRDGDTLELSGKKVIAETGGQISDAVLSGYSKSKLRQLYAEEQISRQQYERAMKKH